MSEEGLQPATLAEVKSGKIPAMTVTLVGNEFRVRAFVMNADDTQERREEAAEVLIRAALSVIQTVAMAIVEMKLSPCGHVPCGISSLAEMAHEHAEKLAKRTGQDLLHMKTEGNA